MKRRADLVNAPRDMGKFVSGTKSSMTDLLRPLKLQAETRRLEHKVEKFLNKTSTVLTELVELKEKIRIAIEKGGARGV